MKLGELLIQKKLLTKSQLDCALEEQRLSKDFLGLILVRSKMIREEDLIRVLSEQFHIPIIDLKRQPIDWSLAMRFSPSIVVDHQCLPFFQSEREITVALLNPLNAGAISRVEEQAQGLRIRTVLVTAADMQQALLTYNAKMLEKIRKMLES
jgi:type IV pilus assembly protein PilB